MRILLIAYEFPPIVAAQALRWRYLANGLARLGVEVDVLCPDIRVAETGSSFKFSKNLHIHRSFPGPFVALSQWLAGSPANNKDQLAAADLPVHPWKLHTYLLARRALDKLLFPDLRSEWYPFARPMLKKLLETHHYHALISSHEPGVDVLLGLWAKRRFHVKWILDLGDPLVTPYTPRWRRKADMRFERLALNRADKVLVTTPQVIDLLSKRHAVSKDRFAVVPQGFPDTLTTSPAPVEPTNGRLHLVFTGSFYEDFRNPQALADALRSLAAFSVRLSIAGDNSRFASMYSGISDVHFLGKIDHTACLALQAQADVLINIGNLQPYQVPGKIYEYLGAYKPVLHIRSGDRDAGANLIKELNAGLVVENQSAKIRAGILQMLNLRHKGQLMAHFQADPAKIAEHSWSERTSVLFKILKQCGSKQE